MREVAVSVPRWLEYAGLIGFIGTLVTRRLAANPPRIPWARPPMHFALAAAFVGGLGVVAADASGASSSTGGAAVYLFGEPQGWVRVGRVAAQGVALLLCLSGRRFVAAPALMAAGALVFAGHATGVRFATGAIFTDALHVLSAGMWAGGIIVLATLRPPGGWAGAEGQALLHRFSRVAVLAFAVTALTGVLRASEELNGISDLWSTSYGVVLSLKSAGVLAMLVMSAHVWRRVVQFARAEAVIALLVLAATAVLAAYPMPPGGA